MKTIITVLGKDTVGILAKISTKCAENNVNVIEVTQSVLQDMFAMIMMADITGMSCDFTTFSRQLEDAGKEMGVVVHTMHENIFHSMHRI